MSHTILKIKTLLLVLSILGLFSLASCKKNNSNLSREDTLSVLDAKIKKNKNKADLYYQRGRLLLEMGKQNNDKSSLDNAVTDLNKAISIKDSRPQYYTALGDAYFCLGDVGKSYSALQKALALDDHNFEAALKMGEIAFYSKDFDRAMEMLNIVTEKDKQHQTALFMKGFIYKSTGDTANAAYYFRRVIDLYPDYAPAYEELGMTYAPYNPKIALDYLTTARSLDPNNVNILYGLAMIYQDAEDADMANDLYVKILELDPDNANAWFNRGWLSLVLYEDYPAAVDFFSKAIDCDNQYADAHYNRGLAYELMGNKKEAEACFKQTLSVDPNYPALTSANSL